jgi:tryptophan synthase alpha chain
MSRIKELFEKKRDHILSIYYTAGYPELESTMAVLQLLQKNNVDLVELGIPYSDPLADGETIQESSACALKNGMTISHLFGQLKELRSKIHLPVILMGYLNPVLQYGFERFCHDAAEVGIDGLILPDLPAFEFEKEYKKMLDANGLDFIFLVTPETPEERVRKLDSLSSGFLYAVSSSSTTGKKSDINDVHGYLKKLRSYQLQNPVLVGFGIHDKKSFETACQYSNGAIIGSAFVKALTGATDVGGATSSFIQSVRS